MSLRSRIPALAGSAALVAGLALGLACSASPSPEEIASRFWSALREGSIDEARAVALPIDAGRLDGLGQRYSITAVELGEATETGEGLASVETTLPAPGGSTTFAFPTHLTRVQGEWRVDAQKTLAGMSQALIAASLEQATEALRESGRVFGEAVGRGAFEASEVIEEALREFSRALEEGSAPPEQAPPASPTPRTPQAPQTPGTGREL